MEDLDLVTPELQIIKDELKKVDVDVPIEVIASWSIEDRAAAEQWAIRKRWKTLSRPPCPASHAAELLHAPLVRPRILHRWVVN